MIATGEWQNLALCIALLSNSHPGWVDAATTDVMGALKLKSLPENSSLTIAEAGGKITPFAGH